MSISPEQSAAWYAAKGAAGEQPDELTCDLCGDVVEAVADVDGWACPSCWTLVTGESLYGPDRLRDTA